MTWFCFNITMINVFHIHYELSFRRVRGGKLYKNFTYGHSSHYQYPFELYCFEHIWNTQYCLLLDVNNGVRNDEPFYFLTGMYKPLSDVRDMNNKLNEPYEIENDNYVIRGGMRSLPFEQKIFSLLNIAF